MSAVPQILATGLLKGVVMPAREQGARSATARRAAPPLVAEVLLEPDMGREAIDRMLARVNAAVACGARHVRFECRSLRAADMATVAAFVAAARRLHRAGITSELASADDSLLHLIDLHLVRGILAAAAMRLPSPA